MNRRIGFTLIEMITVAFLVAVLAAVVVPALYSGKQSHDKQSALFKVVSSANDAREWAKQTGNTYELSYEDATKTLSVKPYDSTTDPNVTTQKQKPVNTSTTASTSQTNDSEAPTGPSVDVKVTDGFKMSASRVRTEDTGTSTWKIKFYSDGTADPGYVEWDVDNQKIYLKVDRLGRVEMNKAAATQDDDQWSAGNVETRTQ